MNLYTMFKIRNLLHTVHRLSSQAASAQLEQKITSISQFTLDKSQIDEAIKSSPKLSLYSEDLIRQSYEVFQNHGIPTRNYLEIITKYPQIISRNPKKIIQTIEWWRNCQFGEKNLYQLITKYPNLLDVQDGLSLLKKVTFLRSFVSTNKNVWKLIMGCPNLISDSENLIEDKFKYLTEVMRIGIPEIYKSEVFSKDLDEIKCRHIFIERLGIFKPRSPKADPNELSNNPRLHQITDTSDKNFATKTASVTLEEYEAFKQLFKRELERSSENSDSSDEEK